MMPSRTSLPKPDRPIPRGTRHERDRARSRFARRTGTSPQGVAHLGDNREGHAGRTHDCPMTIGTSRGYLPPLGAALCHERQPHIPPWLTCRRTQLPNAAADPRFQSLGPNAINEESAFDALPEPFCWAELFKRRASGAARDGVSRLKTRVPFRLARRGRMESEHDGIGLVVATPSPSASNPPRPDIGHMPAYRRQATLTSRYER